MANNLRNTAAGLGDLSLIGHSYLALGDALAGGGAKAVTYPLLDILTGNNKSKGLKEDFVSGFVNAPGLQQYNKMRDSVTKVTGADDDSIIRDVVSNLDIIFGVGASTVALKKASQVSMKKLATKAAKEAGEEAAAKGLSKEATVALKKQKVAEALNPYKKAGKFSDDFKANWARRRIAENNPLPAKELVGPIAKSAIRPRNVALGAGMYTLMNEGEKLLFGDSFSPSAAILGTALVGGPSLKQFFKNKKTMTDNYNLSDYDKRVAEDIARANEYKRAQRRMNWDASGGARDSATAAGIFNKEKSVDLGANAEDRANRSMFTNTIFKDTVETTLKNEMKNNFQDNNMFGTVNATMGARLGVLRQALLNAREGSEVLSTLGLTEEQAAEMLSKMSTGDILERFDAAMPLLEKIGAAKGLNEMPNKELRDKFVALRQKVGRDHFMSPKIKEMYNRLNKLALNSGLINIKEFEQYSDDIASGIYVPLKNDDIKETLAKRSTNPYRDKRSKLINMFTKEVKNQGVDDPMNSYNTLFNKVYSTLVAIERNNLINSSIPSLRYSIDKARESINETISRLNKAGKTKDADVYKEMLDNYKPIHTITKDEIKEATKGLRKHKDRQDAVDKLRQSYINKGYYELVHYKQGKTQYTYVPKDFQYVFDMRPVDTSFLNKFIKATNRLYTGTISGKWNPFFLPKRMWYAINELAPAIKTELAKQGIDVSTWDVLKMYFSELDKSINANIALTIDKAISDDVFLGKLARGSAEKFQDDIKRILSENEEVWKKINEYNIIKNDVVGEAFRNTNGSINVSIKPNIENKIYEKTMRVLHWVDSSSAARVVETLKNTIDDATPRTIIRAMKEYNLQNAISVDGKITNKGTEFVHNVTRKMADTRRRGTGNTISSKFFNAIQDYAPYGSATIQGIAGKLEYLPKDIIRNSADYIKRAYQVNNGLLDTGLDVLGKIGQQLARLDDSAIFNVLWTSIALPSTLCYIWNYGNEDNARYYNSLKPWERSNKFQLVNFLGEGVNFSVPIDQEWSIVKNIYDCMLERMFGLGESYDRGNPAFSMRDQMLWSLGQDFGINLPVAGEAALNLTGFKTNLDAGAMLGGELPIQAIDSNRYHTVPDGLAEAMISMTGKLGKIIVNVAEDRPVMDYRYAIPFLQIDPKQKSTSDTVSYLNRELKLHPTPELQEWNGKRKYIMNNMSFYDRYGVNKSGKILGSKEDVHKMYQTQLDELNRTTYENVINESSMM